MQSLIKPKKNVAQAESCEKKCKYVSKYKNPVEYIWWLFHKIWQYFVGASKKIRGQKKKYDFSLFSSPLTPTQDLY